MDGDDSEENKKTKTETRTPNFLQRYIANVGDVLSPLWIRRFIQVDYGFKWFILGCRYRFLFNFRMFLVVLYLAYETFIK